MMRIPITYERKKKENIAHDRLHLTNRDQRVEIYHEGNKVYVVINEIYTINFVPIINKYFYLQYEIL